MSDDKSITRGGGRARSATWTPIEAAFACHASGLAGGRAKAAVIQARGRSCDRPDAEPVARSHEGERVARAPRTCRRSAPSGVCVVGARSSRDLCTKTPAGEDKPARGRGRSPPQARAHRRSRRGAQRADGDAASLGAPRTLAPRWRTQTCARTTPEEPRRRRRAAESAETVERHKPEEIWTRRGGPARPAPARAGGVHAQVAEIELPGEGVAGVEAAPREPRPLNPATARPRGKPCARSRGRGQDEERQGVASKAISEEDAHRGQPDEPPPDGTIGPRRGPGPVASAEGSASVSGGTWRGSCGDRDGVGPRVGDHRGRHACPPRGQESARAVEHSVRQHGKRLGATYRRLAAERIVTLDTPADDGTRLSLIGATQLVDAWAQQGPIARKAVAR